MTSVDFNLSTEQTRKIVSLNEAALEELAAPIVKSLAALTIDSETDLVKNVPLGEVLKKLGVWSDCADETIPGIPTSIYLLLYIRLYKDSELSNCRTYADFKKLFLLYADTEIVRYIFDRLCHYCLVYMIVKEEIHGDVLFSEYEVVDWPDLDQMGQILLYVRIHFRTVLSWLSAIAQHHAGDGNLNFVARYIYEWAVKNPEDSGEIENDLTVIAKDSQTAVFLSPLLSAMKEVHEQTTKHYMDLMTPVIDLDNSYAILYALGIISSADEAERDRFYQLLLAKRHNDLLSLVSFIDLCRTFRLFRAELMREIEFGLPTTDNGQMMGAILLLLSTATDDDIEEKQKWEIERMMMVKKTDIINALLNHLLRTTAVGNPRRAYDLLECRLRVGGSLKKMEEAIQFMVSKDILLFQERLIAWLLMEEEVLHVGLRSVCSAVHTQPGLFAIPARLLAALSNQDKAYIAYKIAGYIYSMEPLQWLIISVVKSIAGGNAALRDTLYAILDEYIIYNYRTTLDILRKEVADPGSNTEFSLSLFGELIKKYDAYFLGIAAINLEKELAPYKGDMLLNGFYTRKQFKLNPDAVNDQPLARFLKKTQINSDRWAVRRTDQIKHDPQPLGTYSVKFEFPSGEKLNPVFQEHIRRTYQQLRKYEIDID